MQFSEFHPESKLWVYQADRELTAEEVVEIKKKLKTFIEQWTAHGAQVEATAEIRYNRFIVLVADPHITQVTGCSIDASVHFIQQLGQEYQVNFFDRFCVAYKDGDQVKSTDKEGFQTLIDTSKVDEHTIVFNNTITTKAKFEHQWEVPMGDSWHMGFFSQANTFTDKL